MNTITARQTRIRNSFDAGEILSLQNPEYRTFLEDFFDRFLRSDLRDGDISQYPESAFQQPARARIVAKESGVMAGLTEIRYILNARGLPTESEYTDGDFVQRNDIVLTLSGKSGSILKLERISLISCNGSVVLPLQRPLMFGRSKTQGLSSPGREKHYGASWTNARSSAAAA